MANLLRRGRFLSGLLSCLLFLNGCKKSSDRDGEPKAVAEGPKAQATDGGEPPVKPAVFPLLNLQGDSFDIRKFPKTTDDDLVQLKEMPNLQRIVLDKAPITDRGMIIIGKLPRVNYLALCETQVTDKGLAYLKKLTELEVLRLDKLRITDAGLEEVKAFPKLKHLSLWRTAITDAGLDHLKSLKNLEHLSLDETRVSDEGLKSLLDLPRLRYLSKWRTKITEAGVTEFKLKRPGVKVNP